MHNYRYLGIQGQQIFLILYSDSHPNCYFSEDLMTQLTAFFVTQPLPPSRRCGYLGGHDPPLGRPNSNGLIFLSASTTDSYSSFSMPETGNSIFLYFGTDSNPTFVSQFTPLKAAPQAHMYPGPPLFWELYICLDLPVFSTKLR